MSNGFIKWLKDKYLLDLLWIITKFQLVYLALVILGDLGNEAVVGLGTIFKMAGLGWCGYSIWMYFKNETDLVESYSISRRVLFTMVMIVWCLEALLWGNIITKLAINDWWIVPQNGFSVQNFHNGGEYITMACVLICVSLIVGLVLKSWQRFWLPFKEGREEEVSNVLKKIGQMFLKELNIDFGRKICIIITVLIVLFSIYPVIDLFVLSSDNVVNSHRDVKKYFKKEYNMEVELVEVIRDKKDYKYYRYSTKKGDEGGIHLEQKYIQPQVFEKGVPRWEIVLTMHGKEIEFK